jgi:hypothetical protein
MCSETSRRSAGVMLVDLRMCMLSKRACCVLEDPAWRNWVWMVPVHGGLKNSNEFFVVLERKKGIRWMPWHQEAMKDVARCEKPWGAASRL